MSAEDDSQEELTNLDKLREISEYLVDPEFLIKLFEDFPDAIIVANSVGFIQLINKQAELLFGYPRNDLMNQPVEKLVPVPFKDEHVLFRKVYTKEPVLRKMGQKGRQIIGLHKDGSHINLDIVLNPIMASKGLFVVAIVRR